MTTAQDIDHVSERPEWNCRACGRPWPCSTARGTLLHEYRAFPSLLRIYLSAQMYDALEDMIIDGAPPLNLYQRFLGWAWTDPPAP
ncbi:hypothetical protein ACWT_7137 [Actinoplanes sp. SE50]|uniref:hypothetical protein n=1 Tax=unclassified Actinoplanes TaxID=2626549 RepID=UPI0009C22DD6|nr:MULTISPECIES: hypothetical protein [unclassified Actinoplanes]ATO86552.1 hypothetical protein ACWT_7137 [Actinoplanes sp. SE50]SLM03969.1 hypothetical protein ACSP50_7268 [Actinoplanes sp. SE50/110]